MKNLTINYDLIHKIYEVQGKKTLPKSIKTLSVGILPVGMTMQGLFLNMPVVHTLAITAISTAVSFGIITASGYLAHKIGKIAEIATFEDVAILQLEELSIKLNKQNIKTNVKLLLESEMYHEEYKFTLSKNNVSGIMQRKFFMSPYMIMMEVLQKHPLHKNIK